MTVGRRELATARRLERAAGSLAARTVELPTLAWIRGLDADVGASVGLVVHAGINAFVAWLRDPETQPASAASSLSAAPRATTRKVSLARALELFREAVNVVEEAAGEIALPGTETWLHERLLVFSREVAMAIAYVYAAAAEERGAWDARLQALLIDELLADETPPSLVTRASSLGWDGAAPVVVIAAALRQPGTPETLGPQRDPEDAVDTVQRLARGAGLSAVAGMRGDDLLIVLGGSADPLGSVPGLLRLLGDVPIVTSDAVSDLADAAPAARAAASGLRVVAAWPQAPRPALASQLLPERALAGDTTAQGALADLAGILRAAGESLVPTLACYLEEAGSLEDCARRLFVHVNTVRYRLGQVQAATGLRPADPRDAFVLRVALIVSRLVL